MARAIETVRRVTKRALPVEESDAETDSQDGRRARTQAVEQIKRVKRERVENGRPEEEQDSSGEEDEEEESLSLLDEDESEDEDGEMEDYDEPKFDNDELVAAYNAAQRERKNHVGSTSEAGVLKSISLIDFMCHRHLTVEFGPKMNFLVGHNGSGKSAVLTAIAVALGGKAMTTGRGQGLKDLIRKGADKAVITLTLVNKGAEAFKPDVYTPHVVIERTLAMSGSSNYKFRASKDGRTVATKRAELTAICENFNITIDSPLTILTQDQARSFLQNTGSDKLYKFFLDGTQLSALAATYDASTSNIKQLDAHVSKSRECVPGLKEKVGILLRKLAAVKQIMEQKDRSKLILNEIAWAYVAEREKERDDAQVVVDENEVKVDAAEREAEKLMKESAHYVDRIRQAETDIKHLDESRQPLQKAVAEAKEKHRAAKRELVDFETDIAGIQEDIEGERGGLSILQKKIEAKLRVNADVRRDEHEKLVSDRNKFEEHLAKARKEKPRKQQQHIAKTSERQEALKEVEEIKSRMEQEKQVGNRLQGQINNLERQSVNRLSAFGSGLDAVMRDIQRAQWRHSPPIGPFGMHVTLEDPVYRDVLQALLGNNLCSFAVRDKNDRETLSQILKRHSKNGYCSGTNNRYNPIPPIHLHTGDLFDYSKGDLSRIGPTILSKLKIDNEHVLRLLINMNKIEIHFLARTIFEANNEMKKMHQNRILERVSFYAADHQSINGTVSNKQSGPVPKWRGNTLFVRDLKVEVEQTRQELQESQRRLDKLNEERRIAQEKVARLGDEVKDLSDALMKVSKSIKPVEDKLNEIRNKLVEMSSTEMEQMEGDREDRLKKIEVKEAQLREHLEQKLQYEQTVQQRAQDILDRQAELDEQAPHRQTQKTLLESLMLKREELKSQIKHYEKAKMTYMHKKEAAERSLAELQRQAEDWTIKAQGFCQERVRSTKTADQLNKERTTLEASIKEAERMHGVSTDALATELRAAKAKLDETVQSTNELQLLCKVLKMAMKTRQRWWSQTRSHVAMRAKTAFVVFEGLRAMDGRLDFNHREGRLNLIVHTMTRTEGEDGQSTAKYHYKTPKNLSGANRNVAAKSLMDGARESDGKQFILITPQDMAGIDVSGPGKKLIRMADPTRNQATLNF